MKVSEYSKLSEQDKKKIRIFRNLKRKAEKSRKFLVDVKCGIETCDVGRIEAERREISTCNNYYESLSPEVKTFLEGVKEKEKHKTHLWVERWRRSKEHERKEKEDKILNCKWKFDPGSEEHREYVNQVIWLSRCGYSEEDICKDLNTTPTEILLFAGNVQDELDFLCSSDFRCLWAELTGEDPEEYKDPREGIDVLIESYRFNDHIFIPVEEEDVDEFSQYKGIIKGLEDPFIWWNYALQCRLEEEICEASDFADVF